jgi:hypothetical protein
MAEGLTYPTREQALAVKRDYAIQGRKSRIARYSDGWKVFVEDLPSQPTTQPTLTTFALPPEEQEALYYGELEAKRARAEKEGIVAPRRREIYGVPVTVPSRVYSDIQALEESRRNAWLQKQQEYKRINSELVNKVTEQQKNDAMIATYKENLQSTTNEADVKELNRMIERLEIRNAFLKDDIPLLRERMEKLEEKVGGNYNPETGEYTFTKSYTPLTEAQKNAIIVASRTGGALAGYQREQEKIITHAAPYVGHVKGGLKAAARQTTGEGEEPKIAIAGLPEKTSGMIGVEQPAIGRMEQTEMPEAEDYVPQQEGKGGMDLSKLKDGRFGTHL